jgi:hypothetical protein
MWKLITFVLLVILNTPTIYSQDFEGVINYLIIYNGINMNNTSYAEIYCKNKNLKTIFINDENGNGSRYTISISGQNYFVDNINRLIKLEITTDSDEIKNSGLKHLKKLKKTEKILGYQCIGYGYKKNSKYMNTETEFLITDSISANYTMAFMIKDLGIVLKRVDKLKNGNLTILATHIISKKLDDKIFELPDYPIEKVDFNNLAEPYLQIQDK